MRSFCPPWLQAYVPLLIWLGISLTSTALVITSTPKCLLDSTTCPPICKA